MLGAMALPLAVGGLFVLAQWHREEYAFSASTTLIFYGLALLSGSRFTLDEIGYLGYLQLGLGIFVAFFPVFGIDAWTLGFGLLHLIYGLVMYRKYEQA